MDEENLIGKQVGNYRLIAEIAAGSFGTVYQARHLYLSNRLVALKLLHMNLPARERDRFIQEAQFLESLQHPRILSVVDIGFDDRRPYLVSAYAPGGSLRDLLNNTHPLPLDQAITILTQVGEALHYAHQQNIVHCDLKPENILFNAQGEALLADFGIATVLSTMSVKQLADPEGTPSYMAPEQFHGQVSRETDQYAFGCIAYEMVTGQRVFSAPNFVAMGFQHAAEPPKPPRQINLQIAVHVEEAILKALAKQRHDRHRDVAAFLEALQTPPLPQRTKEEWINEGRTLYNLKRYEEAIKAFDEAIRLDPNYAYAYDRKGDTLDELKRYEEAIKEYNEAIRINPNYIYSYVNKAISLRNLKRYNEALKTYAEAIRINQNYAQAYSGKGSILHDMRRYEEALKAYEEAIQLDPNLAYVYNNKAIALDSLGRTAEAQQARKKAKELGWT